MAESRRRFASNIVNAAQVDAVVDRYRSRLRDPDLRRWWSRNCRNFLVRESALQVEIKSIEELSGLYAAGILPLPVSKWAVTSLNAGRPVHRFLPERLDTAGIGCGIDGAALGLVADWMATLAPDTRHRRRLHRISVPEAALLAEGWRRGRRQPDTAPGDPPGAVHKVMLFDDGYRIVELACRRAFEREGRLLRNCLHDTDRFRASSLYALRDADDRPHVAIEFQGRLLVQVKGYANSTPRPKYHPYLTDFLRLMRVPDSEINCRLGLIEMNGTVYAGIDDCIDGFACWAGRLPQPGELPFLRDPKIRNFINVYARHGRRAGPVARRTVLDLFRPRGRGWRNHPGTDSPLPGGIRLWHPRLPSALIHMARYDAVPESVVIEVYGAALAEIIDRAEAEPGCLYDFLAENRILGDGLLPEILEAVGLESRYAAARKRACRVKLAAIERAARHLDHRLRGRDLGDIQRERIRRAVREIYPSLQRRLLSDEGML